MRIVQGCQRAGLDTDIWKCENLLINKKIWKNNLACISLVKARELGIGVRTEESIWRVIGYRIKISDIVDRYTYESASAILGKIGIVYLNQILDKSGTQIFTWKQIKRCKNLSCKGRVAR